MDQKRLFLAIAISLAIMIGFQTLLAPNVPQPPAKQTTTEAARPATAGGADATPGASVGGSATAPVTAATTVPKEVPRVPIEARRVKGSISLLGARIDDLVLTDYRETIDPTSPSSGCSNPARTRSPIMPSTAGRPRPAKPSRYRTTTPSGPPRAVPSGPTSPSPCPGTTAPA